MADWVCTRGSGQHAPVATYRLHDGNPGWHEVVGTYGLCVGGGARKVCSSGYLRTRSPGPRTACSGRGRTAPRPSRLGWAAGCCRAARGCGPRSCATTGTWSHTCACNPAHPGSETDPSTTPGPEPVVKTINHWGLFTHTKREFWRIHTGWKRTRETVAVLDPRPPCNY